MNDFWFFTGALVLTAAIAGVWCGVRELFNRWANNDWCRHDWGKWEDAEGVNAQRRYCTKCNKQEQRVP